MTVEEKVQQLLVATLPAYGSPATEVVPASRIKPPGDWQNLPRPYVIHFPVALETTYSHQKREAFNRWPYQVSCFADAISTASAVAHAVESILTGNAAGYQFFVRGQTRVVDPEVNVHHIAVDLEVFETL